jgi:hypothetical protein
MKDIINAFAERVAETSLIAGTISKTGSNLDNKVKIHKIVNYKRKNLLTRKITWVVATLQVIFLIKTRFRNHYLFLTTNPPTLAFITLFCRNRYSIKVLDIYPDALSLAGFTSRKSIIYRVWERQNLKYFGGADHVFSLTFGMAKTISQYCEIKKIKVVDQWAPSNEGIKIIREQNQFIKEYSLEKYFIVMYSGNIGFGHHITTMVEAARLLEDHEDIIFIIIGEGWNKPAVEKLIAEYRLKNCILLPFQSTNMFRHAIQAADVGVVSVSKELAQVCVPSKTYNLIHNEIPLIFITEGNSELNDLAIKYGIGECFTPEQCKKVSDFIISLKTSKEFFDHYKQNLKNCSQNFTSKNVSQYIDPILN